MLVLTLCLSLPLFASLCHSRSGSRGLFLSVRRLGLATTFFLFLFLVKVLTVSVCALALNARAAGLIAFGDQGQRDDLDLRYPLDVAELTPDEIRITNKWYVCALARSHPLSFSLVLSFFFISFFYSFAPSLYLSVLSLGRSVDIYLSASLSQSGLSQRGWISCRRPLSKANSTQQTLRLCSSWC